MKDKVSTVLHKDEHSVWVLDDPEEFGHNDGATSEHYLEQVFRECQDRSTVSEELETRIIDWRSEYHLSRKRSQLLKGFHFDRELRVLEVGCSCGAITSALGESFREVISIEGTYARAKLARMRTKEMENVEIINAPFPAIEFRQKFDLIFCIGVFEYSAVYIESDEDPHVTVLKKFSDLLKPDGELVLAIENQFGLKYLVGYNEDHTGRPFDGVEGYARAPNSVRTFGYHELDQRLRSLFDSTKFYFPYPDYKMPDLVIDEDLFTKVDCGELVGISSSRDYTSRRRPIFNERLAHLQLSKNRTLPFFSNSFLVVASKSGNSKLQHDLAVCFSQNRKKRWSVVTRVNEHDGVLTARKSLVSGEQQVSSEQLTLKSSQSTWINGRTIGLEMYLNAQNLDLPLLEVMAPCKPWLDFLLVAADEYGQVDGAYLDCIWKNCVNTPQGVEFFDREWVWKKRLPHEVVFIRAAHLFLQDLECIWQPNAHLRNRSPERQIARLADTLKISLQPQHFAEYIEIQSQLNEIVYGIPQQRTKRLLKFHLWRSDVFNGVKRIKSTVRRIRNSLVSRVSHTLKG